MKKLYHSLGYAIQKDGESQMDAYVRSLGRKCGGTLHHARLDSWSQNRDGTRSSEYYQLTFVGPENRRGGGYPVRGEYYVTIDVE